MKVWRVSEGGSVLHWVLAYDKIDAMGIMLSGYRDTYAPEPESDAEIVYAEAHGPITITMDGFKITHTPAEWVAIYDDKPRYLGYSEC